jgi:hypothetical protein
MRKPENSSSTQQTKQQWHAEATQSQHCIMAYWLQLVWWTDVGAQMDRQAAILKDLKGMEDGGCVWWLDVTLVWMTLCSSWYYPASTAMPEKDNT